MVGIFSVRFSRVFLRAVKLLTNSFLQVDEYHIGKDLESVPSSIYDDARAVPELTAVAHSRLGQFEFVYFWLKPIVFLSIENKDIVDYSLFAVALSAPKNDKVLAELGTGLAIAGAGWLSLNLQTMRVTSNIFYEVVLTLIWVQPNSTMSVLCWGESFTSP